MPATLEVFCEAPEVEPCFRYHVPYNGRQWKYGAEQAIVCNQYIIGICRYVIVIERPFHQPGITAFILMHLEDGKAYAFQMLQIGEYIWLYLLTGIIMPKKAYQLGISQDFGLSIYRLNYLILRWFRFKPGLIFIFQEQQEQGCGAQEYGKPHLRAMCQNGEGQAIFMR